MAIKDFSARQVRSSQLIASGGIAGTKAGLVIYSASISSDLEGGTTKDPNLFSNVGDDVYFFVSGSKDSKVARGDSGDGHAGVTLFGGDVVFSGTMYAEKMVVEVDLATTGSLLVSGALYVSRSAHIHEYLTVGNTYDSSPTSFPTVLLKEHLTDGARLSFVNAADASGPTGDSHEWTIYGKSAAEGSPGSALFNIWYGDHDSQDAGVGQNILRMTGDGKRVFIMSGTSDTFRGAGGGSGATSPNESDYTDINFYVSGSIGKRGTTTPGVSLFGGDIAVSGAMALGSLSALGDTLPITASMVDIGWHPTTALPDDLYPTLRLSTHDRQLLADEVLGTLEWWGKDDSTPHSKTGASISATATAPWVSEFHSTKLSFTTSPKASTAAAVTRMVIDDSGKVALGHGGAPKAELHIQPATSATGQDATLIIESTDGVASASIQFIAGVESSIIQHDQNDNLALDPSDGFQVMILSGSSTSGATSDNPAGFRDVNFFVSGTVGSAGTNVRGTSLFGGDLVVSGSIALGDFANDAAGTGHQPAKGLKYLYLDGFPGGSGGGQKYLKASSTGGGNGIFDIVSDGDLKLYAGDDGVAIPGAPFKFNTSGGQFGAVMSMDQIPGAIVLTPITNQLLLHCSGTTSAGAGGPVPAGTDVATYISGTVGTVDVANSKGTTLVTGDLVLSGGLFLSGTHGVGSSKQQGRLWLTPIIIDDSGFPTAGASIYANASSTNKPTINIKSQTANGTAGSIRFQPGATGQVEFEQGHFRVNSDSSFGEFRIYNYNGSGLPLRNGLILVDTTENTVMIGVNANDTSDAGGTGIPAGTDVGLYISGTVGTVGVEDSHGTTLATGDLVISGSTYVRQRVYVNEIKSADLRGETKLLLSGTNAVQLRGGHLFMSASRGVTILAGDKNPGVGYYQAAQGSVLISGSNNIDLISYGTIAMSGSEMRITGHLGDVADDHGSDTFLFISGSVGSKSITGANGAGVTVLAGDVVISGSLYGGSPLSIGDTAEISGSLYLKDQDSAPDVAASGQSVLYSRGGTLYFKNAGGSETSPGGGWTDGGAAVHTTTSTDRVGIGRTVPNALVEIYGTTLDTTLLLTTHITDTSASIAFRGDSTLKTAAALVYQSNSEALILVNSGSGKSVVIKSTPAGAGSVPEEAILIANPSAGRSITFFEGTGGSDIAFNVSGSLSDKDDTHRNKGVAVFGGRMVISGTLLVSGSHAGGIPHVGGTISGSIHRTHEGLSYLQGGENVTILSSSNGQITVSATIPDESGWTDDGDVVRLTDSNNIVGIGTTSPRAELNISSDLYSRTLLIGSAGNASSSVAFADMGSPTAAALVYENSSDMLVLVNSGSGDSFQIKTRTNSSINPDALPEESLHIAQSTDGRFISFFQGNESAGPDIAFDVSGSLSDRDDTTRGRGVALFGGRLVVSGTLLVSGSHTGGIPHVGGTISGSIHRTHGGLSYLVAGANTTIVSESNGQITISSSGGGSSEWTDGGGFLYPSDDSGAETVIIGAATIPTANIILGSGGGATFNEQGTSANFRVESSTKECAIGVLGITDQVLILSGGGPTSKDEATDPDVAFYVSGSHGVRHGRGSGVQGTSLFGGDVVVSGSLGGEYNEITTGKLQFENVVSSAQTIDQFITSDSGGIMKYTIAGKTSTADRFMSNILIVVSTAGTSTAPSVTETRVFTGFHPEDGSSDDYLDAANLSITATQSSGVVSVKIQGNATFENGAGVTTLTVSFTRERSIL